MCPPWFPQWRASALSMNFEKVIGEFCGRLDQAGIRYALIGGFAMALRGVPRATLDLDFILMLEDLEQTDAILADLRLGGEGGGLEIDLWHG